MTNPPKLLLLFLRWFCHPTLLPGIEGDLLELYEENEEKYSTARAKWMFAWDVLKLFRPAIIRPASGVHRLNLYGHLRHSFLMFFRIFKRDSTYGMLNILGLALGNAVFLFTLLHYQHENSFDRFHENISSLYRINYGFEGDGASRSFSCIPPAIAPFMGKNIPEIAQYVRVGDAGEGTIAYKEKKFQEENCLFADPDFFNVFSFPLIHGDPSTCLQGPNKLVITESMAKKYFGEEDPVGKTVLINSTQDAYTVTGVAKDIPHNSHIQFDLMLSFWWLEGEEPDWYSHYYHSYVVLDSLADWTFVDRKMQDLLQNERGEINAKNDFKQQIHLQPVTDIYFNGSYEDELIPGKIGDESAVNALLAIGIFTLLMAWVNYVNLSTSRAVNRSKEIGIRKTIGALKRQLIFQFMFESFLMNLLGLIFGIAWISLGLHYLNPLFGTHFMLVEIWSVSIFIPIAFSLMIGSFIAGIYPALVLAAFQPSTTLRSNTAAVGSKGILRKILLTIQYGTSTLLIATTIIVYAQLDFLRNQDLGFDPDQLLVINIPDEGNHKLLADKLADLASVSNVTLSESVPGESAIAPGHVQKNGDSDANAISLDYFHVGHNFFETLDIDLAAGLTLDIELKSDLGSVLLNETAVRQLGYVNAGDAIGEKILINYRYPRKIVGVTKDFHQLTAKHAITPRLYFFDPEWGNYCIVKYDDYQSTIMEAEEVFSSIFPYAAFDFFFLDEFYNRQYIADHYLSNMIMTFAAISILIACFGLLGLIFYSVVRRKKEISLRKVFGANLAHILYLLSRENLMLMLLAIALAVPLTYLVNDEWLSSFAQRIDIDITFLAMAGLIVFTTSFLTSISIVSKAANANPADALRGE